VQLRRAKLSRGALAPSAESAGDAMSEPTYRDAQLGGLLKELRGLVKSQPAAKALLEKVEKRLKFVLRVLEGWDAHHAEQAETLIRLGNLPAANSAATLIFEPQLCAGLYRRSPILSDSTADDRMAEAIELEREVLA
jgi:hypothetical protein